MGDRERIRLEVTRCSVVGRILGSSLRVEAFFCPGDSLELRPCPLAQEDEALGIRLHWGAFPVILFLSCLSPRLMGGPWWKGPAR